MREETHQDHLDKEVLRSSCDECMEYYYKHKEDFVFKSELERDL